VNNNEFPDSQITMNQFDLSLFDNMEVHITKEQFKQVFGVQRRPGKEDFMYFCQLNRMFQVDHVSQFRGFNNSSVYYKLILKKYNQKANVQAGTVEIQNKLDMLTQNSTIDSLFGVENVDDKKAVANKIQTKVLTKDLIRLEYLAKINKELIENASTIISKSNYDLYSVDAGTPADIRLFTKLSLSFGVCNMFCKAAATFCICPAEKPKHPSPLSLVNLFAANVPGGHLNFPRESITRPIAFAALAASFAPGFLSPIVGPRPLISGSKPWLFIGSPVLGLTGYLVTFATAFLGLGTLLVGAS
jgi:hypothetical protein